LSESDSSFACECVIMDAELGRETKQTREKLTMTTFLVSIDNRVNIVVTAQTIQRAIELVASRLAKEPLCELLRFDRIECVKVFATISEVEMTNEGLDGTINDARK
jgi:hypothetical protein